MQRKQAFWHETDMKKPALDYPLCWRSRRREVPFRIPAVEPRLELGAVVQADTLATAGRIDAAGGRTAGCLRVRGEHRERASGDAVDFPDIARAKPEGTGEFTLTAATLDRRKGWRVFHSAML